MLQICQGSYNFPRQGLALKNDVTNILLKRIIFSYRNITECQIDDIFSKFGNIVQKNILKDKLTGLPRGVAFVR